MINYRYKIITIPERRKIVAIGKWGGKTFRATAKASKEDEFITEVGTSIALARLEHKIALAKVKRAEQKQLAIMDNLAKMKMELSKAKNYRFEAIDDLTEAELSLGAILKHYA